MRRRGFARLVGVVVFGTATSIGWQYGCSTTTDPTSAGQTESALGGSPVSYTPPASSAVRTQHNDESRTGAAFEATLTVKNVSPATFGLVATLPVDGAVFAQPLFAPLDPAQSANAVFIATAHNTIYAFDPVGGSPTVVWRTPLGPAPLPQNIHPSVTFCNYVASSDRLGIMSTPVIDHNGGMFVVGQFDRGSGGGIRHELHVLDTKNGQEACAPIIIGRLDNGGGPVDPRSGIRFDSTTQIQRAALLLKDATLYVAFAGNGCDGDGLEYHGWVMAYDVMTGRNKDGTLGASVTESGVFNTTPTKAPSRDGGGIWQSGNGPVADEHGNIYVESGNGPYDGFNLGDAVIKIHHDKIHGTLTVDSHFAVTPGLTLSPGGPAPETTVSMESMDLDLGSAGPVLLPPNHLVAVGKEGMFFLLNRDGLQYQQHLRATHYSFFGPTAIPSDYHEEASTIDDFGGHTDAMRYPHVHSSPVYWGNATNGTVYVQGEEDYLRAYAYDSGTALTGPSFKSVPFAVGTRRLPEKVMPSGILSVSGVPGSGANPIVWVSSPLVDNKVPSGGILRAYDGATLRELWNSGNVGVTRNSLSESRTVSGDYVLSIPKFAPPTVANGRVYLGTLTAEAPSLPTDDPTYRVLVYGLRSPSGVVRGVANNPDFDGDGQPDVVWRNKVNKWNSFWPLKSMTPSNNYANPPTTFGPFAYPTFESEGSAADWDIVATGDFNADGQTDLVWRNASTGADSIWILAGFDPVRNLVPAARYASFTAEADTNWKIAAASDFNGDGTPDLVWHHATTGEMRVWMMGSSSSNTIPVLSNVAVSPARQLGWDLVGSGDWDLDGTADLVWRNQFTGDNSVWHMVMINGVLTLRDHVLIAAEADLRWKIVGVADYNKDGRPDLVWRNDNGDNRIGLTTADSKFSGDYHMNMIPLMANPSTAWSIVGPK